MKLSVLVVHTLKRVLIVVILLSVEKKEKIKHRYHYLPRILPTIAEVIAPPPERKRDQTAPIYGLSEKERREREREREREDVDH